ncbi:MAG: hypothetical protein JJT94_08910 [Bernardetiaceae bacterium]|nr:hypothetical protein [Bernardetiaceae bacterium]
MSTPSSSKDILAKLQETNEKLKKVASQTSKLNTEFDKTYKADKKENPKK